MINGSYISPPKWSKCGGIGDLVNSWRMLVKLGSLKSDALSLGEMLSLTMRTWLANDGLFSKKIFTFLSCLDVILPLPNMSSRKIYFWHDLVNARSARDKFLRSLSANGSFESCSTMETIRSSGRRESGGFSMLAKRNEPVDIPHHTLAAGCLILRSFKILSRPCLSASSLASACPYVQCTMYFCHMNTTYTDCRNSDYAMTRISARCSNSLRVYYKCQLKDQQCHPDPPHWMFSNFAFPDATTTTQLVVSLAILLLVYGIFKIFSFVYDKLTSPLRHVPEPPNPSFIWGSSKQLSESVSRKLIVSQWLFKRINSE